MITVYCIVAVIGLPGQQKLPFDFTPMEASKFMAGYGKYSVTVPELQKYTCQDIDYTLAFFEEIE